MKRSVRGGALAALVVAVAAALRVLAAPPDPAPELPRRGMDVVVGVGGSSPAAAKLDAASFTARIGDGDDTATVTGVRPLAKGDWDVVIYVDLLVAGSAELAQASEALIASSAQLTALGPVTLLVADTLVEPWVEEVTDAGELRASLEELTSATFETPQKTPDFAATRRALLLDQVGRRPWGTGAHALLVVGDVNAERSTKGGSGAGDSAARRGEVAAAVAALGWVALPFHLGTDGGGVAVSPLADQTGGEAIRDQGALGPALQRLGESQLLRIEAPVGGGDFPIAQLAISGSAGAEVRASRWIATATPAFVLMARVNALFSEDERGELDVEASAQLDSDADGNQELAVEVLTEPGEGTGSAGRLTGSTSRLRATFVVAQLEEAPIVVHHQGSGARLDGKQGWLLQARLEAPDEVEEVAVVVEDVATGAWGAVLAEIDGEGFEPPGIERLAVEVADLRGAREAAAAATASARAADGPLVRLVPPRERELKGAQTFRAMALNAFISRVVFLLDGKQAAEDKDDPFSARLDLGPEARPREIKAVAYDRAGRKLGEDTVTVNRPSSAFGVDIVAVKGAAPLGGDGTLAGTPRGSVASGPIEVDTTVTVPPRRRVERVEIYWNETLEATLTAPPWTAKLSGRPSTSGDYVRAVAHLDDGESLEDVMLIGAAGQVEEVEVNLVEIFAVVLDREGSPVHDLKREEVSVRMGGGPVTLDRFDVAEDLQLDVGLVIDTSQSMEILMDDTRQAAVRFLADLVRPEDRAFLVDFDTKPRLAHPMTDKMPEMMRALGALRASGNTALYDAIVFALLHFEEGEERRAVVLLTDGEDYGSRFSAHQASLQAKSAGVPVYLISLAGMDWQQPGIKKTDLETIAKQTGGHVFYVSERDQISAAYARISAELRSQYVLAFATPKALSEGELAKLDVRVSRPGTTVRAVVAGRSVQTR